MEVKKTPDNQKKVLKAIIDNNEKGIYFRVGNQTIYISETAHNLISHSLESLLSQTNGRKPIYEGDSITITF